MGKYIEVRLKRIQRDDFNGRKDPYEVSGRLWGVAYNDESHPDDQHDLFTFPDGPVFFAPGHIETIDQDARFLMDTGEPGEGYPLFLKFGGELFVKLTIADGDIIHSMGEKFRTLHSSETIWEDPQKYRVRFQIYDTEFRCDFEVRFLHYF